MSQSTVPTHKLLAIANHEVNNLQQENIKNISCLWKMGGRYSIVIVEMLWWTMMEKTS